MVLNGIGTLGAGAVLGALGVVFGAFGSHYFGVHLDPDQLDAFETAVHYQLYHALLLVAIGFSTVNTPRLMILAFVVGVICFSGSIYGLVLFNWSWVGPITPIGGTLLIVGWVWLALWSYSLT